MISKNNMIIDKKGKTFKIKKKKNQFCKSNVNN